MDTKLTLKLEEGIIEKAKDYAKQNKTSLSKMVEHFLQKIVQEEPINEGVTPLVKSLSGIVKLPNGFDAKKAYTDYLVDKY